jgi:glycosyltransferase involved in cell wall biosynthesis
VDKFMAILSVIIPTYNSEETIEQCLNSLTRQTYRDFEVCIVDGASSDGTIAKVNRFCTQLENIKIVSEADKGTYDAMNKGIDIAQGDWVYFLGSDDQVHDENVFADIFKTIPARNCGIIYGNVQIKGDTTWAKDSQIYDGEFSIHQLLDRNICHQAMFYRKRLFDKLGKYNLRYPMCADWALNLRFFPRTKPQYVDRIIADFRGGGISSQQIADPIGQDLPALRKRTLIEYNLYRLMPFLNFT